MIAPQVLALMAVSLGAGMLGLYSGYGAVRTLVYWNPRSGSSRQIRLEHQLVLLTFLSRVILWVECLSFFGLVATAENLHPVIAGAMCAAGVLNANAFGYPALVLKGIVVLLSGLWLILDTVDQKAWDQPLVRVKLKFFIGIVPLLCFQTILEWLFFLEMKPEVITTCCSLLFGNNAPGLMRTLAGIQPKIMAVIFFSSVGVYLGVGLLFLFRKQALAGFFLSGALLMPVSFLALFSFISISYYELPFHHCPFCILKKEYYFAGYLLYGFLMAGCITGIATIILQPLKAYETLEDIVPEYQKRLCLASMISYTCYALLAGFPMMISDFVL